MKDLLSQSSYFFLEGSLTPIYRWITSAYKYALERKEHYVFYFDPCQYASIEDALKQYVLNIVSNQIDYLFIFDGLTLATCYLQEFNCFAFERSEAFLIFIHYDNIWSEIKSPALNGTQRDLLSAWHRVNHKSIHFCLEYNNYIDLKNLGILHSHPIFHASGFKKKNVSEYTHEVLFVGHVLPGLEDFLDNDSFLPFSHYIATDFWARLVSIEKSLLVSANSYANRYASIGTQDFFSHKSFYYYILSSLSTRFRGEILKRLHHHFKIDIIGGDPSYLHSDYDQSTFRGLQKPNIYYYLPTTTPGETRDAYASSKINLNITSPQFDNAVVNRVIDVAATGSFLLTDLRSDLKQLTTVYQEISYRTIDELNYKIDYYLTHEKERLEIAAQLHHDIADKYTYEKLIEYIFSKISAMDNQEMETVCVDLGCGIHKPVGFIGVDTFPAPNVDIVADLNLTFPFPDNSVDYVRAHDVIEHLEDRLHTMNEIWRICKPGALVDIRVPSTDGRGAFQDPTHISFWNVNSFKYYSIEYPAYLELCQRYGFQGKFSIVDLAHEPDTPDKVIHLQAKLKAIKSDDYLHPEMLYQRLHLRSLNLVIFPDWSRLEEGLYQELGNLLSILYHHPQRHEMTLLIDKGSFGEMEEVSLESILYELILHLSLDENIEITEDGPEISLLQDLSWTEYKLLASKISYRIVLIFENPAVMFKPDIQSLLTCNLEILNSAQLL